MNGKDLEARIARLESANRRMKTLAIGAVIVASLSAVLGVTGTVQAQKSGRPRSIEAEQFILRNTQGTKTAEIGNSIEAGGPAISFFDSKGNLQSYYGGEVMALSDQPTGIVTGPNGRHLRMARAIMDGTGLAFLDEGKSVISIGSSDNPSKPAQPKLELSKNGKVIWSAPQ